MKQILLSLLLLCSLSVSAQDVVVTRQKKQQTTTTKQKQNGGQKPVEKKQGTTAAKPKTQSKPAAPRQTASYSNGVLTVNGVTYPMVYVQDGTF